MATEEPDETMTKCYSERWVSFGFKFEKPVKNGPRCNPRDPTYT